MGASPGKVFGLAGRTASQGSFLGVGRDQSEEAVAYPPKKILASYQRSDGCAALTPEDALSLGRSFPLSGLSFFLCNLGVQVDL